MNEDFKMLLWLLTFILLIPLIGLGVQQWRQQDCRIELAKLGRTAADIVEICK